MSDQPTIPPPPGSELTTTVTIGTGGLLVPLKLGAAAVRELRREAATKVSNNYPAWDGDARKLEDMELAEIQDWARRLQECYMAMIVLASLTPDLPKKTDDG